MTGSDQESRILLQTDYAEAVLTVVDEVSRNYCPVALQNNMDFIKLGFIQILVGKFFGLPNAGARIIRHLIFLQPHSNALLKTTTDIDFSNFLKMEKVQRDVVVEYKYDGVGGIFLSVQIWQ